MRPHYQHSHIGYNYRMSNILNAGIGRGQMQVLYEYIDLRRENHSFYSALFENKEGVTVFTEPRETNFSNHWLSAIIDADQTGFTREDLRLRLEADNIEARPLWKPMHLQPVFKDAPYYGANVSEELVREGLVFAIRI